MALQSDQITLIKSLGSVSHTGNTNEIVLFSGLIPTGRILANDALNIFTGIGGISNANNKTIRYRFDTSAGTVGSAVSGSATLAATWTFTTNFTITFKNSVAGSSNIKFDWNCI